MNLKEKRGLRVAILDLNNGQPNQGMRCLRKIVRGWGSENGFDVELEEFDVRVDNAVPGLDFDVYLSSGGPGSPLETENAPWENSYFDWVKAVEKWNENPEHFPKKHVLFICHSFQLLCRHFGIGNVTKRKSTSFGVFPIHLTDAGAEEVVFQDLKDPFYAVDSRDYQVVKPDWSKLDAMGGKILAIEKDRPHVPYERAVMAVRFNEYFIGTQFHPEADPEGMTVHFQKEDKKQVVIDNYGFEKWQSMMDQLNDPDKISYTYSHIIPNFLSNACQALVEA